MLRFLLLLMLAYVYAGGVQNSPYKTCVVANPMDRYEFGACTQSPCTVFKGFNFQMIITFKAPISTDSFVVRRTWKVNGKTSQTIEIDGCPLLRDPNFCPLVKGQDYYLVFVFPIPTDLELGLGNFTILTKSKENKAITCAVTEVNVVTRPGD